MLEYNYILKREDTINAIEYITDMEKMGYSMYDIIERLVEAGYSEEIIESAIRYARKQKRIFILTRILGLIFFIAALFFLMKAMGLL